MAFYVVVSTNKVYVDFGGGSILGFSTGQVFDADPALPSMQTLLRAYPPPIVPYTPNEAFTALPAGQPGGSATLDGTGHIPVAQLPAADALDAEVATAISDLVTGFKSKTFTGNNGAGSITLTGAAIGDKVAAVWILDGSVADVTGEFESVITVTDQIQQSSAVDYSLKQFAVLLS